MREKIIQFPRTIASSFSALGTESNEYGKAVLSVQNTMITLRDITMVEQSNFNNVPKTYEAISRCYGEIQSLATKFTSTIYDELVLYPNVCILKLNTIDGCLEAALKIVNKIIDNPESIQESDTQALQNQMTLIMMEADSQIENLDILIKNLKNFEERDLADIEKNISQILNYIDEGSAEYKQAKAILEELKEGIRKDINEQIAALVGSVALIILAVIDAVVTIAIACATGGSGTAIALSLGLAGLTVAGSIVGVGLSSYELYDLNEQLKIATSKLSGYEDDILEFENWKESVEQCKNNLVGIEENLQLIKTSWVGVRDGFATINENIAKAEGQLEQEEWQKLKAVLEECQKISTDTKVTIEGLIFSESTVSKAKIEIGMTPEQVQEAIERAERVSFKEYMLAI